MQASRRRRSSRWLRRFGREAGIVLLVPGSIAFVIATALLAALAMPRF